MATFMLTQKGSVGSRNASFTARAAGQVGNDPLREAEGDHEADDERDQAHHDALPELAQVGEERHAPPSTSAASTPAGSRFLKSISRPVHGRPSRPRGFTRA